MISVEEARAIVLDWCRPLPFARVRLGEALGRTLAEPAVADIDLPPFDKALVDGYAVRSSECASLGPITLRIGEEIPAGKSPTRPLAAREAAVIMTGAPLPDGADAVVMHEKTRTAEDGVRRRTGSDFGGRRLPGARAGNDRRSGRPGGTLRP